MAKKLKWDWDKAIKIIERESLEGLYESGEIIMTASKKLAPHSTGEMEDSGVVIKQANGVFLGYNGPYVVKQHQDQTLQHPNPEDPRSLEGREAGFLLTPLNENKGNISRLIDARVKSKLR